MDRLSPLPWQAAAWGTLAALQARGIHAVLIHGQSGTGKLALALAFAHWLLCENPIAGERACGTCAGCRLGAAGGHPDLRVVVPQAMAELLALPSGDGDDVGDAAVAATDAAAGTAGVPAPGSLDGGDSRGRASREIRIEQVRALGELATLGAHRRGRRVVVLGPAECLNPAAANAALKLLEEPPAGMMFLLVSDALDQVLATIRSRCVLLRAARPDPATAVAWLRAQGVADPQAALAEAGGAPLRALAQPGRAALDDDTRATLLALLRQGAQLEPAQVASQVPRSVAVAPALALMQRWGWDVLAHRHGAPLRYHLRDADSIARLAQGASVAAWLDWQARLGQASASADHPLNARLVIEAALLDYIDVAAGAAVAPPAIAGA